MDATDEKIIRILQKDSRTPITLIAEKVGITRKSVQTRLKRLETEGVILKYTLALSEKHMALKAAILHPTQHPIKHLLPETQEKIIEEIITEVKQHPDVVFLARLEDDILLIWHEGEFNPYKIKRIHEVEEKKLQKIYKFLN